MKKKFFLSAILISLFGVVAAKPAQADTSVADIQKRGELVVGVKQDVPNFGYKDPKTGTYSGIETDLAKMVADELKVKVRYVPVTAQTRGPLLDNEQVDMDIATFTITDERKKLYNFTSPYYTDASGFLVNKSAKIKSIEDLNGKTIGDVLAVMQKLAHDGMNMIVVTHEMGFAREVADRIIFMADGEVLVDTTDVDDFFDNPSEPRAQQFLSKIINHESDKVK